MSRKPFPPYIRLVPPGEQVRLPYRVEGVGRGISPEGLYRRERELPLSILHMCDALDRVYGREAVVRFLDAGVAEGFFRRFRTRDGGWLYRVPCICLIPGIQRRIYEALVEVGAAFKGISKSRFKRELTEEKRRQKQEDRRRKAQCSRKCGCFVVGIPCGLTGRVLSGDQKRVRQREEAG